MPIINLAGRTYEVDEDGFLQELEDKNGRLTEVPTPRILCLVPLNFLCFADCERRTVRSPRGSNTTKWTEIDFVLKMRQRGLPRNVPVRVSSSTRGS